MSDPKYLFPGGIEHATGGYPLPDDEPLMLFRGKDVGTPAAIRGYIDWLETKEQTALVVEHLATANERLSTIVQWQTDNPNRIGVGCQTIQQ